MLRRLLEYVREEAGDLREWVDDFEYDVCRALAKCHGEPDTRPVSITITASQEGTTMGTYTAGTPVDLVADVKNDQQVDLADTVTWTADQGTVIADPADPTNPLKAQLVNAPVGTVTVTGTTSNGLVATDPIVFTDPNAAVPASITISDSAAPAATPAA